MKRLGFGILAMMLLALSGVSAMAWDFSMTGQFEWRYRYFGRANGYQDLFGDMRFQDSFLNTTGQVVGFAGPNFYRGFNGGATPMPTNSWGPSVRIVRGGFSYADSDASAYDQRMTFLPEIRVNNAIRLTANMDLASIRQKYNHRDLQTNGPMDRWYQDRMSQNAFDTAMIPSINQFKLTVQLPWGILSVGAKDYPLGTGALLGYNTRASALLFVFNYGPFRIVPGLWLSRNPDGFGPYIPYTGTGPAPNSVVNLDSGEHHQILAALGPEYNAGTLCLGVSVIYELNHTNSADLGGVGLPGSRTIFANGPNGGSTTYVYGGRDFSLFSPMLYGKYNNGRLFANVEYNWLNLDQYYLGAATTLTPGQLSGAPQLYGEYSNAFAEGGVLCGPARFAAMFAWSGGPVLNNGNATKAYGGMCVNNQATDAYNYLVFHTYGGGNDAPWAAGLTLTNDENGQMADAYALAGRLDYAIAANLNLWGSYLWASRVEQNGFYAGGKASSGISGPQAPATIALASTTAAAAQAWKNSAIPGAGAATNMNPYVDDSFLGWEADLGVDWKLLENMSVMTRYAYWQLGPWFDQAYRVVGQLPNNGGPSQNAFMQGRSAIQAFTSSVVIDF